jgi:hypothetical protein
MKKMLPVLDRLEEDLDTKVRRLNVNRRKDFLAILECVGHDEFGGFPFYFNRRTAQAVAGATGYSNLRKWATGHVQHIFQDPPENMHEQEPDYSMRQSQQGAKGLLLNNMLNPNSKSKRDKSKGGKGKASSSSSSSAAVSANAASKGKESKVKASSPTSPVAVAASSSKSSKSSSSKLASVSSAAGSKSSDDKQKQQQQEQKSSAQASSRKLASLFKQAR